MRVTLVSAGVAVLVVSSLAVAAGAAPDRRPPRIVAAAIVDADRDARADGARLTYSERVRHAADRDGRYSFTVAGYRIRSVGAARGKVAPAPAGRAGRAGHRRTAADPLPAHAARSRCATVRATRRWSRGSAERAPTGSRRLRPRRHRRPHRLRPPLRRRPTATATARSTARTALPATRRSIPGRPICPISPSSTRTATVSTASRRTRSSRPRRERTRIPAPEGPEAGDLRRGRRSGRHRALRAGRGGLLRPRRRCDACRDLRRVRP